MTDVVDRLRAAAPRVFADAPVAFAYLFGSHATGRATDRSDVDVAVRLDTPPRPDQDVLGLRFGLADALERAASVGPVEVVVLDEAPLSLRGRVQEQHVLLYCGDPARRVRYESLTARRYHDFKIHESRAAAERLAALAEGR